MEKAIGLYYDFLESLSRYANAVHRDDRTDAETIKMVIIGDFIKAVLLDAKSEVNNDGR